MQKKFLLMLAVVFICNPLWATDFTETKGWTETVNSQSSVTATDLKPVKQITDGKIITHDIGILSIIVPETTIVTPLDTLHINYQIRNFGASDDTVKFSHYIYDSLGTIVQSVSGNWGLVSSVTTINYICPFEFVPQPYNKYHMVVYTTLDIDENYSNDTMTMDFRTWDLDVGASVILNPGTFFDSTADLTPRATFHNYASQPADFDAVLEIDFESSGLYSQTISIAGLPPYADTTLDFPVLSAPHQAGNYTVRAYSVLDHDLDNTNDTATANSATVHAWQYVSPIPDGAGAYTRWSYCGSCVSNGKLWMVGGRRDVSWAVINNNGTYDPATDTWDDTKPVLNQGRVYLSAASNQQYVFALGGRDPSGSTIYANVERLAVDTGTAWQTMTPLPEGRVFGASVEHNGYIYHLGGTSDAGGSLSTTSFWRYDIAGDTVGGTPWEQGLAQLPVALYQMEAAVLDGKIYIPGDATYNSTYIYNIAGDSWDSVGNGSMPGASQYKAVAIGEYIWRIGGILSTTGSSTNLVWQYDPAAQTWSEFSEPMQSTRISFGAGLVDGKVVSAGGVAYPGFTPTLTAEIIDVGWLTGVEGKPPVAASLPSSLKLMPNYPNPVKGRTTISFNLQKAGQFNLKIYNIAGQMVKSFNGQGYSGNNSLVWDASKTSAGIYFYQLSAGSQTATRKLIVVK
jgi:hypothetical protein